MGGRLVASRRLLDDQLYDRPGNPLQAARSTLRIRRDGARGILTFKGPVLKGPVKIREEIETEVSNTMALEGIVAALGFTPFFRAQKYREEFEVGAGETLATLAMDDTPIGIYVEIEAERETIAQVAEAMGRSVNDYVLNSYQRLFTIWATARGESTKAMLVRSDVR